MFRGWGAEDFEVVMWSGSVTVEEGSRLDMSQPPGACWCHCRPPVQQVDSQIHYVPGVNCTNPSSQDTASPHRQSVEATQGRKKPTHPHQVPFFTLTLAASVRRSKAVKSRENQPRLRSTKHQEEVDRPSLSSGPPDSVVGSAFTAAWICGSPCQRRR